MREAAMSDSLVFYWDRVDNLNLVDPDAILHSEGLNPVIEIVIGILNAGYEGVIVDEKRLSDGRYFQGLNVNLSAPEGWIVAGLQASFEAEEELPSVSEVLQQIKDEYDAKGEVK
jgi:hypothetical protein